MRKTIPKKPVERSRQASTQKPDFVWGEEQHLDWMKAVSNTAKAQQIYNELLAYIDRFRHVPPVESLAPRLLALLSDLNRLYDLEKEQIQALGAQPASESWFRKISPAAWLRRIVRSEMKPAAERQHAFHSVLVHLLNELNQYLSSRLTWQQQFFEIQAAFFLQITPWIDAKINELRAEENHNIAHHVGIMIHDHIPRAFQEYNRQLQDQIRDLMKQIEPYQIRMQNLLAPLEMQRIPETLMIHDQHLLHLQRMTEELWHGIHKQHHDMNEAFETVSQEIRRLQAIPPVEPDPQQYADLLSGRYKEERLLVETAERERESASQEEISRRQNDPAGLPGSRDFRYFVFEEVFRGSGQLIRERMARYVPCFQDAPEPIVDIGCGRGEFLTLMREAGKKAYGVEINAYEVSQLRELGYAVEQDDAVRHLESLEKESIGGVFCAQVIEHLNPEDAFRMIQRLAVVMKSGAPLVVETLNPLSVAAYHSVYLLDPTHVYPVLPQTLTFWLRYAGFNDVRVQHITPFPPEARLPKPEPTSESNSLYKHLSLLTDRLNQMLYGNAEYFVIGYRP